MVVFPPFFAGTCRALWQKKCTMCRKKWRNWRMLTAKGFNLSMSKPYRDGIWEILTDLYRIYGKQSNHTGSGRGLWTSCWSSGLGKVALSTKAESRAKACNFVSSHFPAKRCQSAAILHHRLPPFLWYACDLKVMWTTWPLPCDESLTLALQPFGLRFKGHGIVEKPF